jgi:co-chaperonin GroES (HSP10)
MTTTNAMRKAREIAESSKSDYRRHIDALEEPYADTVLHSQVLCMTFIQPARTAGGILIPDKSLEEDRFQAKLFLVIAMGPGAFKDDKIAQFHDVKVSVGDWVLARPSDGMEIFYNGNTLRLFQDVDLRLKVKNPKNYW